MRCSYLMRPSLPSTTHKRIWNFLGRLPLWDSRVAEAAVRARHGEKRVTGKRALLGRRVCRDVMFWSSARSAGNPHAAAPASEAQTSHKPHHITLPPSSSTSFFLRRQARTTIHTLSHTSLVPLPHSLLPRTAHAEPCRRQPSPYAHLHHHQRLHFYQTSGAACVSARASAHSAPPPA